MSYEGYEEHICENGHHWTLDAGFYSFGQPEDSGPDFYNCPHCGKPAKYMASVDQTNGYYEDDPSTFAAPKKEVGFEDKWQTDHYGNKYAVKIRLYEPDLTVKRWRHLK